MDVSQLPISQLAPHDKELRLATQINALVDTLERRGLSDRAGDDYLELRDYKDWIVDDFQNVFNPLDSITLNESKAAYVDCFIEPKRYKVMYDKVKSLGPVKDYIASLQYQYEKDQQKKTLSPIQLQKRDQLKMNRLIKSRLDFVERMKIEAYEAVKEGDYLIFSTLTAALGQEHIFDSGNNEVKDFIHRFQMDVADAYLSANNLKNDDRSKKKILWDVCRYLRVYEYGDKNGREHAHIFWRVKALPHYIANPYEVSKVSLTDFRETLPGMAALWGNGNISYHQPLRYGGDAFSAAGFPAPKQLSASGTAEQKPTKPVDAIISYVGNYINTATETEIALREQKILNKSDDVYNNQDDNEETKKCKRVKTSRGFGKLRVRQQIATAPLPRLKALLQVSPQLEMVQSKITKKTHSPSWRLLRTELIRRLTRDGILRPFYLELHRQKNIFQQELTDPVKEKRILSYALTSSGRSAVPVTKNTAACELSQMLLLKQFYDDYIPPLDCPDVLIGAPNRG